MDGSDAGQGRRLGRRARLHALGAGDLPMAIVANVRLQAELLSEASPVIAGLIREGRLKVAGGVYDLSSGRVTPVAI